MNLVNGATYRFLNRNAEGDTGTNGKGRSLNVYGTQPTSLANVCLYTSDDNDICQQWVYMEEANGEKYLKCKGNMNLALDLYTGSSSIGGVKDFNAHVFAPSETSRIDVGSAGDGYIYIRLTYDQYRNKYLTANAGVNGTNSGKSFNSNGNIYFTDLNEGDPLPAWKPILLAAPPDPKPPVGPEPEPSDGQVLIYPVNKALYTCGYKVTAYGVYNIGAHYGHDIVDANASYTGEIIDNNIIASGSGLIYRSGWDKNVGFFACIVYPNALVYENGSRIKKDLTVRYWHMKAMAIPEVTDYNSPVSISRGDIIGTMGREGVADGVHLHVECDTDTTPKYTFWTPTHFKDPKILQNGTDTTINPGFVFQIGANQKVIIKKSKVGTWLYDDDYKHIGDYTFVNDTNTANT